MNNEYNEKEILRLRLSLEGKDIEINNLKITIKGMSDQIDEIQSVAEKMLSLTKYGKY